VNVSERAGGCFQTIKSETMAFLSKFSSQPTRDLSSLILLAGNMKKWIFMSHNEPFRM
jgi:hypothetical protein